MRASAMRPEGDDGQGEIVDDVPAAQTPSR